MSQDSDKRVEQEFGFNAKEDAHDFAQDGDSSEEALEGEILEAELPEAEQSDSSGAAGQNAESVTVAGDAPGGADSTEGAQVEEAEAEPSLEELYKKAVEKSEANRNDYLRSVADMQNLRKRTARDVKNARSYAIEGFARDLLPVADNMSRALAALGGNDDPVIRSLREGVEMVQKELDRAFSKHGLSKIEAINKPFDPNLHQAVVQIDDPEATPGQVVQEMQIGYTLNDRLLRPAMVGVAKN